MTTKRADLALPGLEPEPAPLTARTRTARPPRTHPSAQLCAICARWLTRERGDVGEIAHTDCLETLSPPTH